MTAERRSGNDRRANPPGRLVHSRGPIIIGLEVAEALTAIFAVVALIISLTAQAARLNDIQISRFRAAEDSCGVLTALVYDATPAYKIAAAREYLAVAGLSNCETYAKHIISNPK